MAPSRLVAPPRVAASPCALECKVTATLDLPDVDGTPTDYTVLDSLFHMERPG